MNNIIFINGVFSGIKGDHNTYFYIDYSGMYTSSHTLYAVVVSVTISITTKNRNCFSAKISASSGNLVNLNNNYYNVWSTANTCECGSGIPFPDSPCTILVIIRHKT